MMKYLQGLNERQKQAVECYDGPVRVLAGPGTGKTRTLTSRFCYLVERLGISPAHILSVTFTNLAASEMKHRIRGYLGEMELGYISTFHAFCVRFLKDEINVLNFPKNFIILDTEDQKTMLSRIFADMKLTLRDYTVRKALDEVLEAFKLKDWYISYFHLMDNEQLKREFSRAKDIKNEIFLRYLYEQKKVFGCDFNDLIVLTIYILENFQDIRQKWQEKMQFVMVDEFQDVSRRQYTLACILAGHHKNLFIVGDPDQTIYTWRGAHVSMFLDFPKAHPGAVTIDLGLNYRSTPQIVAAASSLIKNNQARIPRIISSSRPAGPKPVYYHAKSDKEETKWICQTVVKLRDAGVPLKDIAVLYRTHRYVTRELEEQLVSSKIPYQIYSGVEFYGRREVKDIICYLRMVAFGDDAAFLRTYNAPKRKIGRKRLNYLKEYAEERKLSLFQALKDNLGTVNFRDTGASRYVAAVETVRGKRQDLALDNVLQAIMDLSGYEEYLRLQGEQERLDNAAELKRSLAAFAEDEQATLEEFLNRAALFSNIDKKTEHNSVKLMTIHSAKGLEFNQVFLIGVSTGILPSSRSVNFEEVEEERRLAYVAMTRAIDGLYLTDSEGKTAEGNFKTPSVFIHEIGKQLMDYVNPIDHLREPAPKPRLPVPSAENLFGPGDLVSHDIMGQGIIVSLDCNDLSYVVKFDKLATVRNIKFAGSLSLLKAASEDK
jgi:DNA helicase-2/ATP-dependent DNA helicase PcrA